MASTKVWIINVILDDGSLHRSYAMQKWQANSRIDDYTATNKRAWISHYESGIVIRESITTLAK